MAFVERYRPPDPPEFRRPYGVPFQCDQGATGLWCGSDTSGEDLVHLHVAFEPTPKPAQTLRASNTEASSFPHLQTIAHWLPWFSKGYQDRHHRAEWLILQLTKLPKTQGRPSRKARSRPKVVEFDPSLRHVPGGFPTAKPSLPKIGGLRSPTVAFVQRPWDFLEEACLRHLAEATPRPGSHVRDKIRRVVLSLVDSRTAKMVFNAFDPSES